MRKIINILILVIICFSLFQCGMIGQKFSIISGSENEALEPILQKFANRNGVILDMKYKGSVDMMLKLQEGDMQYDAVWPANSLWISIGDTNRIVKHVKSIMTSPVVFGIKKSKARELGFIDKKVKVKHILDAIRQNKLKFMMTSATQSNSGASAFIGFLYALAGNPEILQQGHLHDPELQDSIIDLFQGINRSSGSSGWLKDLFLKGDYEAMVNYEAMIIEANQELVKHNREPLHVVYPVDGIVLADSPLGYISHGDGNKEKFFLKLQEYLLTDDVQKKLKNHGRRTGFGGIIGQVNTRVFNPDWGIEADKILSPIKMPSAGVIFEALNLYQTDFRKPSYTIFCLDFSGSMRGVGDEQLKKAMSLLLNKDSAQEYLIQGGKKDIIEVITFNSQPGKHWVAGYKQELTYDNLLRLIINERPGGGTDIYTPAIKAIEKLSSIPDIDSYIPAVILMTDGLSKNQHLIKDLEKIWNARGNDIPIFSIMFGEASGEQLERISHITRSRVFDGKHDLIGAFRKAKGYN